MPIPKFQTAAVVGGLGKPLEIRTQHPVTQPEELQPGQCLVKMEVSGVCHTDLHAAKGDWPILPTFPLISGHEGVGHVVAIAAGTTHAGVKLGDRVGIKWLADSCLQCEMCRKGLEQCTFTLHLLGASRAEFFVLRRLLWRKAQRIYGRRHICRVCGT
jgi:propanol-preferring alcohol dehydrogenase